MTYQQPSPMPGASEREYRSRLLRLAASGASRPATTQRHNGESEAFEPQFPTNFTKGLPHDVNGIVQDGAFQTLMAAITQPTHDGNGRIEFNAPLGPGNATGTSVKAFLTGPTKADQKKHGIDKAWTVRGWESPVAGHVYDLQGPDADAVAMSPAPRLGSDELAAELAEVYAMALLRDTTFEDIRQNKGETTNVTNALAQMPWFDLGATPKDEAGNPLSVQASNRHQRVKRAAALSGKTLFRGSVPGVNEGPYISQFLYTGTDARAAQAADSDRDTTLQQMRTLTVPACDAAGNVQAGAEDGYILYGAQRIDQRVQGQKSGRDYMCDWAAFLDVQNGANVGAIQAFETGDDALRFINTPRDLATYVHFDQLYQAYLNACLLFLAGGAATDIGLPEQKGGDKRAPFATFGGPHVLSLVTEVATRALKAVRRQKFAIHARARPEALAGVTTICAHRDLAPALGKSGDLATAHVLKLREAKHDKFSLLGAIHKHNENQGRNRAVAASFAASGVALPDISSENLLLPMAFPEGSPMHPTYGAGHATVAGACVTVLKAFFQMYDAHGHALAMKAVGDKGAFATPLVPTKDGQKLEPYSEKLIPPLTLVGELNKLAANISIGRNMAGVHFYSDYYDSLRMGERIATGILQEQMTTYGEALTMTWPSFDDERITLRQGQSGQASLNIDGSNEADWYARHAPGGSDVPPLRTAAGA